MDEAFEKLDPGNRLAVIRYLHDLGLQLVVAAPKTGRAVWIETMGVIVDVLRYDRTVALEPLYIDEQTRELLRAENPFNNRDALLGTGGTKEPEFVG
jgi:hypothetical protein